MTLRYHSHRMIDTNGIIEICISFKIFPYHFRENLDTIFLLGVIFLKNRVCGMENSRSGAFKYLYIKHLGLTFTWIEKHPDQLMVCKNCPK